MVVTHKKISEILKNWHLENETVADVFYENGEKNDHAFFVGDQYFIKCAVNFGTLKKYADISRSLENLGLSAAVPIKTAAGEEIVKDGQLCFCLTRRLQGEHIKVPHMYEGDYQDKARFVGEMIGQLSLALAKVDAVVNDVNMQDHVKNWAFPKAKDLFDIPERFWQDAMASFDALYGTLPKQIIHRDPNPGNIIMAEDAWGFIDFDLSERNIRIYDPCYAATAILSESFDENNQEILTKWIEIYKNILYGYDSVAKLSDNETKAVPYVILFNQLICCAWLSGQEKYKQLLRVNQKMTAWICAHFDKLTFE